MRLLVVGREGQIARSLRESAANENDLILQCIGRPDADLLRPGTVTAAILKFRPDIVVNAAAYTAVDKAEDEPDLAFSINCNGAQEVAIAAASCGVPIIHFSTDYVFDGMKSSSYNEQDIPNPQNVYGHSKLAGERAVMSANAQHLVLRTCWVYAPFGANFVGTVWRKLLEGQRLRIVNDQTGCPTYAPDLAEATIALARRVMRFGWRPEYSGITHIAGPDALNWHDFAQQIASRYAAEAAATSEIVAVSSSEYSARAIRPANSRLSTRRLRTVFEIRLRPLQVSLDDCLDRISKEQGALR
ncbi:MULTISPECIES: dTDP-4-dehydrorhamnose reductase [unclassified Bradyrhizobium]|uniref:dTDP-4-dehydrorhamnose reductase n=1 Tax=unclassified Bradyrhizobium TaxID=2631580 RepID=UPI001FF725CB|nr:MULTISPECIES: dTDP-4-dehydrorhamnose reductase [unclassified Bradyrhizobium]MCK1466618.1 dTDP-4-dehydrorhamnose reductase [Bradyrhizobium sp. CW10]MCK1499177.1 dTDP-4-dehydrorhamnose reductase [Bradyrhizobium sp. 188]